MGLPVISISARTFLVFLPNPVVVAWHLKCQWDVSPTCLFLGLSLTRKVRNTVGEGCGGDGSQRMDLDDTRKKAKKVVAVENYR